jgi:hypothetical protein
MSANTLNLPRHRDPLARAALLGLVAVVAWLGISQPGAASLSAQAPIIVLATPALRQQLVVPPGSLQELAPIAGQEARPTPNQLPPTPEVQPGVELAAPTIDPAQLIEQQPTASPAVTLQDTGAGGSDTASDNPFAGMETVNGHSFVQPAMAPAQPIEQNPLYVPPEVYLSLPTAAAPPVSSTTQQPGTRDERAVQDDGCAVRPPPTSQSWVRVLLLRRWSCSCVRERQTRWITSVRGGICGRIVRSVLALLS